MGLCSAFLTDAFAGNFCSVLGKWERKERSRSHVNSGTFHDSCDGGISSLKYAQKCKLLTGLATTPILRIDEEVTDWMRDLFTLPNDRVDSLQWRKYDPALSQKWPLSLHLHLYHCWQNAADGWGTTKSSKVVRDIGFQWSQKKHLAGQTWVLRWRTACCCVWDKSGKVKWRSLALT